MTDSPCRLKGDATAREEGADETLQALARRVAESDADAFETLFRTLSERVFRYVRGMTGNASAARDVTQETFTRLWTARDGLDGVERVEAYVFQIARRRVYNLHRDEKTRRDNETLLADAGVAGPPEAPDDELDSDMLRDLLDRWIQDLPERQREALTLRRMEHMSHDAIADVMGISPNTVNTHLMRAMNTLRDRLREHRPDLVA
jgi:RNA polymerase sigma-70 factor (ECF subfamily)